MGKKDRLCPNPVMAHKKKMKQKEIKRNKRHKVERQEAQELLRDPDALAAEIARVAEDATHSSEARAISAASASGSAPWRRPAARALRARMSSLAFSAQASKTSAAFARPWRRSNGA